MYQHTRHRVCMALIFFSLFSIGAKAKNKEADALFQAGMTLYQQRYSAVAITPLEKAANLGHAGAAYQVGEILRRRYTFITEEAEEFYRQAAEGGEVYAMLRLAKQSKLCGTLRNCDYDRERWLDLAFETALPKAEAGDTDAMMALGSAYAVAGKPKKDFEWIERAAKAGDAFAQYWMAIMLDEQDHGFYWTEEGRRQDVLKWLIASAEQGYPKAMYTLAREYRRDGRNAEAMPWIRRLGQTDYFEGLFEYGLVMSEGGLDDDSGSLPPEDVIKGLATLLALHRETGNQSVKWSIDKRLPEIDPELIKKAQARSAELLVDTPILHYLPKFGI